MECRYSMGKKVKVLEMASTFPRWEGDTEPDFIYQLSKRLKKEFDIVVLAPHCKNAKKQEVMEGVNVFRFSYFFIKFQQLAYDGGIVNKLKVKKWTAILIPFFMFFCLVNLILLIRREQIRIIHAHWIIPMGIIAIITKYLYFGKLKVVCTSHGGDMYCFNGFFLKKLKVFFLNRCDHITVVSTAMKNDLISWGGDEKKISVISMGVDLKNTFTEGNQINKKQNSALFVGRLVPKKGVHVLVKAAAVAKERNAPFQLDIIGAGPERKSLEKLVIDAKIQDYVNFLGPRKHDDLPEIFRSYSVTCIPSITADSGDKEGLGLVTIEAMGCGCTVVASDFEAVHDVVEHGKTGIIIPQNDAITLAEAITDLFSNENKQKILAENGRNYVLQKYDWKNISGKYICLIKNLTEPD